MPESDVAYTWIDGAYRAPGHQPLTDGGQPPAERAIVSIYSGPEQAADNPFVAALGEALTSGTMYYTNSALSSTHRG